MQLASITDDTPGFCKHPVWNSWNFLEGEVYAQGTFLLRVPVARLAQLIVSAMTTRPMEAAMRTTDQRQARDIAAKLRLTAALLGGLSQKGLCAAFRRVNPQTGFELDRSYKWMQGRSLPRSTQVYEDWADVLGLGRPGGWVAGCGLDAFLDALCGDGRVDRAGLLRRAGLDMTPDGAAAEDATDYLCAAYACYSQAQSPCYRGSILRGTLVIQPAPRRTEGLVARYSQYSHPVALGPSHVAGRVVVVGGMLALPLTAGSAGTPPVSFHLYLPAPPGSLLAGIMGSCTMMHPGGQPPYATRVAMVRVPLPAAALEASNRTMEPAPLALSRDLAALGLRVADPAGLEARMDRFLRPQDTGWAGSDQIPMEQQVALSAACDRAWLDTIGARSDPARRPEPAIDPA